MGKFCQTRQGTRPDSIQLGSWAWARGGNPSGPSCSSAGKCVSCNLPRIRGSQLRLLRVSACTVTVRTLPYQYDGMQRSPVWMAAVGADWLGGRFPGLDLPRWTHGWWMDYSIVVVNLGCIWPDRVGIGVCFVLFLLGFLFSTCGDFFVNLPS